MARRASSAEPRESFQARTLVVLLGVESWVAPCAEKQKIIISLAPDAKVHDLDAMPMRPDHFPDDRSPAEVTDGSGSRNGMHASLLESPRPLSVFSIEDRMLRIGLDAIVAIPLDGSRHCCPRCSGPGLVVGRPRARVGALLRKDVLPHGRLPSLRFAHRSFKTSRAFQLVLAIGGTPLCAKGCPLVGVSSPASPSLLGRAARRSFASAARIWLGPRRLDPFAQRR